MQNRYLANVRLQAVRDKEYYRRLRKYKDAAVSTAVVDDILLVQSCFPGGSVHVSVYRNILQRLLTDSDEAYEYEVLLQHRLPYDDITLKQLLDPTLWVNHHLMNTAVREEILRYLALEEI
jgi:hypothetical protein